MSLSRPSAVQLLACVQQHMEKALQPLLNGTTAYETRVAINVMAIVRRQLMAADAQSAREIDRVGALVGSTASLADLNAQLCAAIRSRSFTAEHRSLMQHLRTTALEAMAIDNPSYSAYRRAVERDDI